MLPVRIILHPTDSLRTPTGVALACGLARDYKAELVVVHVLAPPVVVYSDGIVPIDPEGEEIRAREKLDAIKLARPNSPSPRRSRATWRMRSRCGDGDPAT
jgi:hypothetical protein